MTCPWPALSFRPLLHRCRWKVALMGPAWPSCEVSSVARSVHSGLETTAGSRHQNAKAQLPPRTRSEMQDDIVWLQRFANGPNPYRLVLKAWFPAWIACTLYTTWVHKYPYIANGSRALKPPGEGHDIVSLICFISKRKASLTQFWESGLTLITSDNTNPHTSTCHDSLDSLPVDLVPGKPMRIQFNMDFIWQCLYRIIFLKYRKNMAKWCKEKLKWCKMM